MNPGRMSSPAVLAALTVAIMISATPINHSKRGKRVVFGRDLKSSAIFNTQFFVELRQRHGCTVDHLSHEFIEDSCQGRHHCGGSLIHAQFIVTAAHCMTYTEYAIHDVSPEFELDTEPPSSWWDLFSSTFSVSKPKHTVSEDWILLAGGTNIHEMTQMRHAHHIFPHPDWISRVEYNEKGAGGRNRSARFHGHDFLLIQACEPFKIDKNVQIARLGSKIEMQSDYKRIVELGLVCLYIGLGALDYQEWVKYAHPPYKESPNTNWTQYTWRPSQCYAGCKSPIDDQFELKLYEYTCWLCSTNQGAGLNIVHKGDSGSPVICEGKLTALVSGGILSPEYNYTSVNSYAIHCSRNMITKRRLEYYLTLRPNPPYHPLGGSRKHKSLD